MFMLWSVVRQGVLDGTSPSPLPSKIYMTFLLVVKREASELSHDDGLVARFSLSAPYELTPSRPSPTLLLTTQRGHRSSSRVFGLVNAWSSTTHGWAPFEPDRILRPEARPDDPNGTRTDKAESRDPRLSGYAGRNASGRPDASA
jgi:hypothetical protein